MAADPHVGLEIALIHPEQVAVGPVDRPTQTVRIQRVLAQGTVVRGCCREGGKKA